MPGIGFITALAISLLSADPLWPDLSTLPEATGGGERDSAVVVAVGDYAYLPDVEGAADLGVAWYLYLTKVRRVPLVLLLRDGEATVNKMRDAVETAAQRVKSGGRVWFVFIGHGAPSKDGRDGQLVGVTAQPDEMDFYPHTMARSEVVQKLTAAGNGSLSPILVLDACFSGTDLGGKTLITGAQFVVSEEVAAVKEATLLTAGRARDIAGQLPGAAKPAFSYLVLGALRGWGDSNGDGVVTAQEAVQYAQDALLMLEPGRMQKPQQSGEDVPLTPKLSKRSLERGPELSDIKLRLTGGVDSGGVKVQDTWSVELAELEKSRKEREAAEGREAKAREAAIRQHLAEVEERWRQVEGIAQGGGPEATKALEMFLARYKGHPLGNPKEAEATEMLIRLGQAPVAMPTGTGTGDLSKELAELDKARRERELVEKRDAEVREGAQKKQLAELEKARKELEQAQKKEADAREAANRAHSAEVEETWKQVQTMASGGGPEGKKAVELFLKRYQGHPLGNSKEAQALEMLERLRQTAGADSEGYVLVKAGCSKIGSPNAEVGRRDDESQHEVCITRAYYMKETEVTQREWREVMGSSPSSFGSCGETCPVESVSWWDAIAYCNAQSKRQGIQECYIVTDCTGKPGNGCSGKASCDGDFKCASVTFVGLGCGGYRLPTEAEWEVAARGGSLGAQYGALEAVAWFDGNSGGKTHPVREKKPNAWGLYDMLGNVWEWCGDWYQDSYYGRSTKNDPEGAPTGSARVYRGGGWFFDATTVRAAVRVKGLPGYRYRGLGLRPVRSQY